MKITYIHHSSFAIEIKGIAIIIDYYKDDNNIVSQILMRNKKIYVLSSHRHHDHFSAEVFRWKDINNDISYILSSDISKQLRKCVLDTTVSYIKYGEVITDNNILVKAFGSTDIGISFMIEIAGMKIFHAGDLNNWHWCEESTEAEIEKANKDFLGKLKAIRRYAKHIDVVMFPVDPRLGGDFAKGARQFVNEFEVKYFIPMHFWNFPNEACQFELYRNPNYGEYICLNADGASIEI